MPQADLSLLLGGVRSLNRSHGQQRIRSLLRSDTNTKRGTQQVSKKERAIQSWWANLVVGSLLLGGALFGSLADAQSSLGAARSTTHHMRTTTQGRFTVKRVCVPRLPPDLDLNAASAASSRLAPRAHCQEREQSRRK